ncbi:MAG: metallophosphoesterase [Theionarchaea archaeon]|nr:metallophosphoesterase [Theionarchaea archaeon]MBU7036993.1 metallophosphoesterase [Theionarchaea archaeon]
MSFVVLTPALACPGLFKKGDEVDVLLLTTKSFHQDELCELSYSPWKKGKSKSLDRKDIEMVNFVPSDCHISEFVLSAYKKEGLTRLVRARIRLSVSKGLYQLAHSSDEQVAHILRRESPDSFLDDSVKLYHPFYIGKSDYLNIAHMSDSHMANRLYLLEDRWNSNYHDVRSQSCLEEGKPGDFSNYNAQVEHLLTMIAQNKDVDIIIHTGDITDYNRGYHNPDGENDLSRDYHLDRNWALFYQILYRTYEKPFFSVLGNHDYRLNPYPPNPLILSRRIREFFNMAPTVNLTRTEMNGLHEDPHALNITKNHILKAPYAVRWYALVLNPLLDYQFFYGNMAFLMLDWNLGEDHEEGNPWAEKALSPRQWKTLTLWRKKVINHRKRNPVVSVVAMHCSVFNPFPEIGDREVAANPETNIFYTSGLTDHYEPQKDLVDGTFRLKRNEFIRVCLGSSLYGRMGYTAIPEKGVDIVLTGHAHRTGIFQVEGPHVILRDGNALKRGPVFCNAISSGPIGIQNEEGGAEAVKLSPPGYHGVYTRDRIRIVVHQSELVSLRESARRSFGEIGLRETFEVSDRVADFFGLHTTYRWRVTNLKEGSTLTRIVITMRCTSPVEVTETPLGWKHSLASTDGHTILVCEAHDRGQGIYCGEAGEIHLDGPRGVERMGILQVAWDMNDTLSRPMCVRVPAD